MCHGSPADAPSRRRGGSRRFADRRARPRSCGGNTWRRLRMLVRTRSRVQKNQAKNVENVALHFRKNALLGPDRGECPRSATHQARAAAGRPFAWAILIVAISNVLGTKITSRWTTSVPHRPNHSPPQVRYSRYLVQGVARDMCLNKLPLSVDRNSTVTPSCLARPKQHRLDGGRADIDSRRHRHAAVSIAAPPS